MSMNYSFLNVVRASQDIYEVDFFKDIQLPEELDKDKVINTIMTDCYDLMPFENNPILLKHMVDNWFSIKKDDFHRIYVALTEDYNPLHNFDRHEDLSENRDLKRKDSYNSSGNVVNVNKTSAFNENVFQNDSENTEDSSSTNSRNIEDSDVYTTNNHLYGNIGVTTSQQMLTAEIDLRIKSNIYKIISLDFRKEFMLSCL